MNIFDISSLKEKIKNSIKKIDNKNHNNINENLNSNQNPKFIENIEKDEIKLLEILNSLINSLSKKVETLNELNWREIKNLNNVDLYASQMSELQTILNAMDDTINILDYLKNYIRYFIIEAKSNQFIPPEIKASLISQLQSSVRNLREKTNRIFLEFNILFDDFSRF